MVLSVVLSVVPWFCGCVGRLQELEDQYRREREEANNLLEQQRLVRLTPKPNHDHD